MRSTYINHARFHMGYHYPRCLSTAHKSAGYFQRVCEEYDFCIHKEFKQVYATGSRFSWTDAEQFVAFCEAANIPCEEIPVSRYFNPDMCDGAFLTQEYTYDAMMLKDHFVKLLAGMPKVEILYDATITDIECDDAKEHYKITLGDNTVCYGAGLLNATYASTNQILGMVKNIKHEPFDLKYELCEIILTEPSDELRDTGITVMDGPFFSIMPFGLTGLHSLTSVCFTPHVTSYETTPVFSCQLKDNESGCNKGSLANCSSCAHRPGSAWDYMDHLARKYMLPKYEYKYLKSLFSVKPILKSSEVDDSRPTAIRINHSKPEMISVLSGKINTIYDLDDYLR